MTDARAKLQVWSYAKHILYQYRGVSQYHFPLYLKEVEYRVTHRQENVFKQFLKIYCGGVCRSSSPLFLSFPRTREGGFTFEVQQVVSKNLGWASDSRGIFAEYYCMPEPRGVKCFSERPAKSVLRGKVRRKRPMAFSMPPFCQGEWVSQKKVSRPRAWRA